MEIFGKSVQHKTVKNGTEKATRNVPPQKTETMVKHWTPISTPGSVSEYNWKFVWHLLKEHCTYL